jgi:hypothetical protein
VLLSNRSLGFPFLPSREVRNWCNPIVFRDLRLASKAPLNRPDAIYCVVISLRIPSAQKDLTTLEIFFSPQSSIKQG